MPESVKQEVIALAPFTIPKEKYDLVIFAFQPWFLHPSLPATAILQHPTIRKVWKNTPVVTVIACRNMWLNAMEKVKEQLLGMQAPLKGNISLTDKSGNLVSLITILRWMLLGKRHPFGFFPKAGVSDVQVVASAKYGKAIAESLDNNALDELHEKLLALNSVEINQNLVLLETRGVKAFGIWAKFIGAGGAPQQFGRKIRVAIFSVLLPTAVFVLSPVLTAVTAIKKWRNKAELEAKVDYFRGLTFKKNIFG
jgi:hypothetical protein